MRDFDVSQSLRMFVANSILVGSGKQYYCCYTVMYQYFCFSNASVRLPRFVLRVQLKKLEHQFIETVGNSPRDSLDDPFPSPEFVFFVISFEYPEVVNSPAKVVAGSSCVIMQHEREILINC